MFGYPTNQAGFKDLPFGIDKPAGHLRVVALGDSFAFGIVPYPDLFLTLIDDRLPQVEVINMGIPRTDTGDYALLMQREGRALAPDMVLLHFFIGNDFNVRPRYQDEPQSLYLMRLIDVVVSGAKFSRYVWKGQYEDSTATMQREKHREILLRRLPLFHPGLSPARRNIDQVIANLASVRDTAHSVGGQFVVILVPEEMQIDQKLRRSLMRENNLPPDAYDFRLPNRVLKAALHRAGIAFLDLTRAFELAGRSQRLYKPADTHWNLAGNALAADLVERYLRLSGVGGRDDFKLRTVPIAEVFDGELKERWVGGGEGEQAARPSEGAPRLDSGWSMPGKATPQSERSQRRADVSALRMIDRAGD